MLSLLRNSATPIFLYIYNMEKNNYTAIGVSSGVGLGVLISLLFDIDLITGLMIGAIIGSIGGGTGLLFGMKKK